LVALAREMETRITNNYIDAWQNGGEVDGKPVDDDRLLQRLLDRRDGVSESDPLWDTYNNDYLNYSFAIEDSKMTLKYAQHQVNEKQMADFYTGWAKKMPPNSEIYRTLMRQAAQFLDAAKARASAGASRARSNAYAQGRDNIYQTYMRDYDMATALLTQAARDANIITPGEDLNDLRASDAEGDQALFFGLINTIATDPDFAIARAQLADLGLAGLNYETWREMSNRYEAGLRQSIAIANQYGETKDATGLQKDLTDFIYESARFNDIDEIAAYTKARDAWMNIVVYSADVTTDEQKLAATRQYESTLELLHGKASSDQTRTMLTHELAGVRGLIEPGSGASTLAEQLSQVDRFGGDAQGTSASVQELQRRMAGKADGSLITTYQTADPSQPMWNVAETASLDSRTGLVVSMSTGANGLSTAVWVPFQPIAVQALTAPDPYTTNPTAALNPRAGADTNIGVTFVINGKRYYGVYGVPGTEPGSLTYFDINPFTGPDGTTISPTFDPQTGAMLLSYTVPVDQVPADSTYDPMDVTRNQNFIDRPGYNVHRSTNALGLMVRTDPKLSEAILQQSPRQMAAVLREQYGSVEAALGPMQNFVDGYNAAVAEHNSNLTQEEIALGIGPGFRAGDPRLQTITNPFEAELQAARRSTGQPRLDPGISREQQDQLIRDTAARLVAQSVVTSAAARDVGAANRRIAESYLPQSVQGRLPQRPAAANFGALWDQISTELAGLRGGASSYDAYLRQKYGVGLPEESLLFGNLSQPQTYIGPNTMQATGGFGFYSGTSPTPPAIPPINAPGPSYTSPTIKPPTISLPSTPDYGLEGGLTNYLPSYQQTTVTPPPLTGIDPVTGRPRHSGLQEGLNPP